MSTQITIDPDVRLPDAYRAEYVKSLARLRFDWIPEEQERSLDYQIEGSGGARAPRRGRFEHPFDLAT